MKCGTWLLRNDSYLATVLSSGTENTENTTEAWHRLQLRHTHATARDRATRMHASYIHARALCPSVTNMPLSSSPAFLFCISLNSLALSLSLSPCLSTHMNALARCAPSHMHGRTHACRWCTASSTTDMFFNEAGCGSQASCAWHDELYKCWESGYAARLEQRTQHAKPKKVEPLNCVKPHSLTASRHCSCTRVQCTRATLSY